MNLIVIPTYDECEAIGPLLDDLLGHPDLRDDHVLVVDDSSPDGTGAVVEDRARRDGRVHLLTRPGKDGLGNAYRAGFAWGLERDFDVIVQMDADGSHPVSAVVSLIAGLAEADLVIGSRYVVGGATVGWPRSRRLVSSWGNAYVRRVLGISVRDATAGFRAFRAEALVAVLRAADGPDHGGHANGYCFQVETTWQAHRLGLRTLEVPITFTDREVGRSKMSAGIAVEALWRVLTWRVDDLRHETARPGSPSGRSSS